MPEHPSPNVVVWEERPRGSDWISWGFIVGIFLLMGGGMAYAILRAPLTGAYIALVPVVALIAAGFVFVYGRRPFARRPAKITLDLDERKLYAENMILHRSFWPPRRTPLYVCELSAVRSFRLPPSRYIQWLYIECPDGELRLDDVSTGFHPLVRELEKHVPKRPALIFKDIIVMTAACVSALLIVWACDHFGWI